MKNLEEIKQILREQKEVLSKKYPIKNIAVFGSYARNEQNHESDLDILVEFNDKIGIEFIDLGDELSDLFDIKVDVVSLNGIKPYYFESIRSDLKYV